MKGVGVRREPITGGVGGSGVAGNKGVLKAAVDGDSGDVIGSIAREVSGIGEIVSASVVFQHAEKSVRTGWCGSLEGVYEWEVS